LSTTLFFVIQVALAFLFSAIRATAVFILFDFFQIHLIMIRFLTAILFLLSFSNPPHLIAQSWEITEVATLPEAVSNNAVVEAFVNDVPYVYSFSGIDESKIFSGIHLKSWRYNTLTGAVETLPPLPDNMGKIAAGANRIDNIIYIIGGYNVFSSGNELTSDKVHRFDVNTNSYLTDGSPIPVPVDDQVQAVWRDSLIYLVTGWSNSTNVPNVQIYNPSQDTWHGASGVIIEDTLFYFGGAASIFPAGNPFPIQNMLRKGVINPENPTEITWTSSVFDNAVNGYRMGATTVENKAFWLGGSGVTYNFDGIAYNNSGGVPPLNRSLHFDPSNGDWSFSFHSQIPMDLRGIASVNDSVKYILGGMLENQEVSDKVFRLTWKKSLTSFETAKSNDQGMIIYPNPFSESLWLEKQDPFKSGDQIRLIDIQGKIILEFQPKHEDKLLNLQLSNLSEGIYTIQIINEKGFIQSKKVHKTKQ